MPSYKILVVEDNALNQKLLMTMLDRRGHTAVLATNGAEAIDILAQSDFEIILMDIQMPIMDGLSATKIIRSGEQGVRQPDIPIIALSANDLDMEETPNADAGLTGWISKPFDFAQLEEEIIRILS